MTSLNPASLASVLGVVAPFFKNSSSVPLTRIALENVIMEIAPFIERTLSPEPPPTIQISHSALQTFVKSIAQPLERKRQEGGLANIWHVSGLKRSEVRVSAALANLWQESFAGIRSKTFLAEYLGIALPNVDWQVELARGYQVDTEICPLGEVGDRVDIIIRTEDHLIAVEVKIDAGLGNMQLERYRDSLERSGAYQSRQSHVVFLAPFAASVERVADTSWSDIATAAECAAGLPVRDRGFTARIIAMFGDYVKTF